MLCDPPPSSQPGTMILLFFITIHGKARISLNHHKTINIGALSPGGSNAAAPGPKNRCPTPPDHPPTPTDPRSDPRSVPSHFCFRARAHGAFLAEKSRDFFLLPRDHGGSRALCEWRNRKVLLSSADPTREVSRGPTSLVFVFTNYFLRPRYHPNSLGAHTFCFITGVFHYRLFLKLANSQLFVALVAMAPGVL